MGCSNVLGTYSLQSMFKMLRNKLVLPLILFFAGLTLMLTNPSRGSGRSRCILPCDDELIWMYIVGAYLVFSVILLLASIVSLFEKKGRQSLKVRIVIVILLCLGPAMIFFDPWYNEYQHRARIEESKAREKEKEERKAHSDKIERLLNYEETP